MILPERTTGEGNSLQERIETKVEHSYHNSDSPLLHSSRTSLRFCSLFVTMAWENCAAQMSHNRARIRNGLRKPNLQFDFLPLTQFDG